MQRTNLLIGAQSILVLVFLLQLKVVGQVNDGQPKLNRQPKNINSQTTIKGNINKLFKTQNLVDSFAFQYWDIATAKRVTIPINKDSAGNFSVTFSSKGRQEIYLSQAFRSGSFIRFTGSREFSFFVKSGEVLDMDYYTSVDRKVWDFKFGGPSGRSNNQYVEYAKKFDFSNINPFLSTKELDSLKGDYGELKKYVTKKLNAGLAFNANYFNTVKTNADVKKRADIDMQYAAAQDMIAGLRNHSSAEVALPEFLMQNGIATDNPEAYGFDRYKRFIDQYYVMLVIEANKNSKSITITRPQMAHFLIKKGNLSTADKQLALKIAGNLNSATSEERSLFSNKFMNTRTDEFLAAQPDNNPVFDLAMKLTDPFLRDLFATRSLYELMDANKLDYIEPNLERYKLGVRKGVIKDSFLKAYQKEFELMNYTKLSNEHGIRPSNQLDPKDPLKTIIEKYKGKLLYIDVWATWCMPCLAEMPNSSRLRDKLKGQDVVFVYVCINSPTETLWKKYIGAKNIKGENYFLDPEKSGSLTDRYNITTIPRYLLIDKFGNIVDESADRPGSQETLKTLTTLLNKN